MRSRKLTVVVAVSVLVAGAAGCGSSKSKSTVSAPSSQASGALPSSVTTGPVRATLQAANHNPASNKPWPYSVRVTDASGHPLSGSVRIEFTFGGQVVGTDHPPVHPIKNGLWHDSLTYPPQAAGHPLVFEAVVTTSAGSVKLGWPVMVTS
jgi:hypothetical protein